MAKLAKMTRHGPTTLLDEHEGKTTLTSTQLFPSQEVRDMLIKAGMASDAAESYDLHAELLESL
ncbi:MAG: hypothetical protein ABI882_24590 [Acidobacteriota bacterium]